MYDARGLTQEILEIRPPCLQVLVPNSVVVYLTQYGLSSAGGNLVLLYRDTVLKNIKVEGHEEYVRFDLEVHTTGIINVVIIPEQTEPAEEISSVAPLPVLPAAAAQELHKVFENTVQAAKSIVVRTENDTPKDIEQKQYLLVEGHVLSDGQEQAIRHMMWKERFRPFAADLDFLLNNPLNDGPSSPRYDSDSEHGDGNLQVAIATAYREHNNDTDDDMNDGFARDRGELEYLDDEAEGMMRAVSTEVYGQVLKGMLKFLSDCNAWRSFFYVMNECAHQGVLFTGLSEVGIQGLYDMGPNGDGQGGSQEAEAEMEALMRMGLQMRSLREGLGAGSCTSDQEATTPIDAGGVAGGYVEGAVPKPFDSDLSPKAEPSGTPLRRGPAPLLASTREKAKSLNSGMASKRQKAGAAPPKPGAGWQPVADRRLSRSSSMPARLARPDAVVRNFTYADLKDDVGKLVQGAGVRALWSFPTPRYSADSLGIVRYLLRVDGVSFSARLAMMLVCSWLCLVGGSSDTGLNTGAFCLGLSGLVVGAPVFVSFMSRYRNLLVVASRLAALVVLMLNSAGVWDCPCLPSGREGHCLGGMLQSVVWLMFMSTGFKAHLWIHLVFLAVEAGAFMLAVSQGTGVCHSSRWVVAGPVLLGEVYSVASLAWRDQQLLTEKED
ncbi:unnamed protein product [Ostreobium quekettii]|uniref:Uncharacterized protein n=1 Tax=Ostreobium quekettii TaxID=121088 RepID=A0A8S1J2I9_9CHLO|nr:unnamed protein product [Ostreobium quekettii]|eukprot:evm.model.scf_1079EXC.6 EVM.evm.TU.scf_1079EXC.6   scf_1079EXC:36012-39161(+)